MSRVTLTNPFDLLTDENEDRTNVPKEQPKAAPTKPVAKPAATGAVAKPPAAKTPAAPKPEGAKAPAKLAADAKPANPNAANQTVRPTPPRDSNQHLQEREKESRPPRDRRDRPPPAAGRDVKHPFDRKSGTGRPQNEVKKGGSGKGNWGGEIDAKEGVEALKEKEEKVDDKEDAEETKEEKPAAEGEEKKEGEEAKEKKDEPPAVEELTYDEYLAKLKQKKAPKDVKAFQPRVVSADDFNAAGLVPLQRGEEGTQPLAKKDKKDKKAPAAGEKVEKKVEKKEKPLAAQLLNFGSHSEEKRKERFGAPREGSFRGGNAGGNGGGERRGRGDRPPRDNRPPRPQAAPGTQPPVQEKDFPALGPHGADQPVKA